MFSNDQNIERIADFVEEVKRWIDLKADYARLNIVDKVVRIVTALVLCVVLFVILILALTYLSFAAAMMLGTFCGSITIGFLIVGIVYILLFVLIILMRHTLIEKPLVRFLVNILAEDLEDRKEANND